MKTTAKQKKNKKINLCFSYLGYIPLHSTKLVDKFSYLFLINDQTDQQLEKTQSKIPWAIRKMSSESSTEKRNITQFYPKA